MEKIFKMFTFMILISQLKADEYDVGKGKPVMLTRNGKADENITDANNIYDANINTFLRATLYDAPGMGVFVQVDLQANYNVTKIIVYAPNDASCSSYAGQFLIFVRSTNLPTYDLNGISFYGLFNSSESSGTPLIPTGSGFNFTKPEGMIGRYVTLKKQQSQRTIDLCIAELIIISESWYYGPIDLINPIQNNVYNNDIQSYGANNSIDKNPTTCSYTGQDYVLNRDIAGWWMVDLGRSYRIYSIAINNNENRNNGGLATFNIYVQESTSSTQQLCYSVVEPIEQLNLYKNFLCASDVSGRYVNIKKTGGDRVDNLLLCEVSVYAKNMADKVQMANIPTILTSLPLGTVAPRQTALPNSNSSQPSAPLIVKTPEESCPQNIVAIIMACVFGGLVALLLSYIIYLRCKIANLLKKNKQVSTNLALSERTVAEDAYSSINNNLENGVEHPYDILTATNQNQKT